MLYQHRNYYIVETSSLGVREMEKMCLSVTETAKELGISRSRAYELVQEGWIPSVRCGQRILIPRRALEKRLDELTAVLGDRNPALLS